MTQNAEVQRAQHFPRIPQTASSYIQAVQMGRIMAAQLAQQLADATDEAPNLLAASLRGLRIDTDTPADGYGIGFFYVMQRLIAAGARHSVDVLAWAEHVNGLELAALARHDAAMKGD